MIRRPPRSTPLYSSAASDVYKRQPLGGQQRLRASTDGLSQIGRSTMIPDNRIPTHPGVILSQEFLAPLGISQVAFAAHLRVSVQRINELIRGKRGITPETAWLLSQALNTTPEFWINLQTAYDLARSRPEEPIERLATVG